MLLRQPRERACYEKRDTGFNGDVASDEDCSSTDNHNSYCEKCRIGGDLICCDGNGCKSTYHLSCLDPPLMEVPPDDWYCPDCAYKKISYGVYAISKDIESIWDVKIGNLNEETGTSRNTGFRVDRNMKVAGDACSVAADEEWPQNKRKEVLGSVHSSLSRGKYSHSSSSMNDFVTEQACIAAVDVVVDEEVSDTDKQESFCQAKQEGNVNSSEARRSDEKVSLQIDQDFEKSFLERKPRLCQTFKGPDDNVVKLYFVKYKRAAHVHNQWIPENQLIKEAPKLLANFKKRFKHEKVLKWNPDWAKLCRIIGKKVTMPPKRPGAGRGRGSGYVPNRCVEWCVKWKGLGYEHCTWEPGDTDALISTHALKLIQEYEDRSIEARHRGQHGKQDNVQKLRMGAFSRLDVQPHWMKGVKLNSQQLEALNTMRNYWQRCIDGIVVDGVRQERTATAIAFLLSLVKEFEVVKPVLVAVPLARISIWENQFTQWSPTVNVVTYSGTKEARELIQRYEFNSEDGYLMVQIVLASFDVVNMDLECLRELEWEALVVDECQNLRSTKSSRFVQQLTSDYRLLLFSKPLKDNVDDYIRVLSFIQNDSDLLEPDIVEHRHSKNENELLEDLKTRMNKHIVYEYKTAVLAGSHLQEYWVPVEMTAIQVQEYCKLLINRYDILSGSSTKRSDTALLLQGLLLKLRECCNHPHLVNPNFQGSMATGLPGKELLELQLSTSGKLQLLEMLLFKAKSEGKRVVVLTQMHLRSEKITQMEILDYYVRHRFGVDSCERVDGGLAIHKKQAYVQRFNAKDSVSFVFLLDKRACGPAIKLPSINFVVIFDSDWNPESDIQALQRVRFNFEVEDIKVYRLYTPHTVEERALISARRDSVLDLNHKSFPVVVCQRLLRWGAAKNFKILESTTNVLNRVIYGEENLRLLLGEASVHDAMQDYSTDILWKSILDCREAGRYAKGVSLYSETDEDLESEDLVPPSEFWSKIMQDKHIELHDGDKRSLYGTECEDNPFTDGKQTDQEDELTKEKKMDAQCSGPVSTPEDCKHFSASSNECIETVIQDCRIPEIDSVHQSNVAEETDRCGLIKDQNDDLSGKEDYANEGTQEVWCSVGTEQQQLYPHMKDDLLRLIQALQLQEDVAKQAERLLLFSVNHVKLQKESKSLLHAVELSMCWLAAQQQNYPIDRCATQTLAESCFGLELSQVDSVFAKLEEQCSKNATPVVELISDPLLSTQCATDKEQKISEKVPPSANARPDEEQNQSVPLQSYDVGEQQLFFGVSQNIISTSHVEDQVGTEKQQEGILSVSINDPHNVHNGQESGNHVNKLQNPEAQPVPQPHSPQTLTSMKERLASQKGERMQMLLKRQKMEISKFYDYENKSKDKLRREFQIECSKVMASRNSEELKASMLNQQRYLYTQKMKDLECILKNERQKLVDRQFDIRDKENKLIASHLERINSGQILRPLPSFEEVTEIDINLPPPMYFQSNATTEGSSVDSPSTTATTVAVQSVDASHSSIVMPIPQEESHGMSLQCRSYDLNQHISSSGPAAQISCAGSEMHRSTHQGLLSQILPGSSAAMPSLNIEISQERMESQDQNSEISSGEILHGIRDQAVALTREQLTIPTRCLQQEACHSLIHTQQQPQHQVHFPLLQQQAHVQSRGMSVEAHQSQLVSGLVVGEGSSSQLPQHHHHQQSSEVDQIERDGLQPLSLHHGQQQQCSNQTFTTSIGRSTAITAPVSVPLTCGTLVWPVASRESAHSIGFMVGSSVPQMTQNAAPSRVTQPYHNDPLGQECLRLKKEQEKAKCSYETEKEKLKAQYLKDQEALRKKFDKLLQEEKRTYIQKVATLEVNLKRAEMNRRLAETFRMKIGHDNISTMNSGIGNPAILHHAGSTATLVGSSAGVHMPNMPVTGRQVQSGACTFNVQGTGLQSQGMHSSRTVATGSGHSGISSQANDQSTYFPEENRPRSTQHFISQPRESPSRTSSSAIPLFVNPSFLHSLSRSTSNPSFPYQSPSISSPRLCNMSSFLVSSCISNQHNALNSCSVFSVSTCSTTVASHCGTPSIPTLTGLQASHTISTLLPNTQESVDLATPPAACISMSLGMIDVNAFPPDSMMLDLQQDGYIDFQDLPLNSREDVPLPLHPNEHAIVEAFSTQGRQAGSMSHDVTLALGNSLRNIENVICLSDDD